MASARRTPPIIPPAPGLGTTWPTRAARVQVLLAFPAEVAVRRLAKALGTTVGKLVD